MDAALPRKLLLAIALIQGFLLLILHQSIEFRFWPHQEPQWLFCLYSMVIIGPWMLLLSLESDNWRTIIHWVLPFTLLCGLTGYYVGSQVIPLEHLRFTGSLVAFVSTLGIASFKLLMYAQQRATGNPFNYADLFRFSWRNFLTLGLALLFMLCVWGILNLWAELFKVIKIDFFNNLFKEPWFYYPALSLAHGFGVLIFRSQYKVIDTITRIQQALMKFLLVILTLVSILFLVTLPFTGLDPLWETNSGSALILCMQALMLFFLNAVYQDDPDTRPYPLFIHRFIYLGIALLPIYSAIAFYGLSLRVQQYGWTVDRCWGFLVWGFLALFSVGYLWGIIKQRDVWLHRLSWVNVRMGILLLCTMILINSPLVDFRKISVNSQLAQLESGKVKPEDFDIHYFRRDLMKPGYEALQKLKQDFNESHPAVAIAIDSLYRDHTNKTNPIDRDQLFKAIRVLPEHTIPTALADAIYADLISNPWRLRNIKDYYLMPVDLDEDGSNDYVLVDITEHFPNVSLFTQQGDVWEKLTLSRLDKQKYDAKKLIDTLQQQTIKTVTPRWKHLQLGDFTLQVNQEAVQ